SLVADQAPVGAEGGVVGAGGRAGARAATALRGGRPAATRARSAGAALGGGGCTLAGGVGLVAAAAIEAAGPQRDHGGGGDGRGQEMVSSNTHGILLEVKLEAAGPGGADVSRRDRWDEGGVAVWLAQRHGEADQAEGGETAPRDPRA